MHTVLNISSKNWFNKSKIPILNFKPFHRRPSLRTRFCHSRSWKASQLSQGHVHVHTFLAMRSIWSICILCRRCRCIWLCFFIGRLVLLLQLLDIVWERILDLLAVISGFSFAPAHFAIRRPIYPWLPDCVPKKQGVAKKTGCESFFPTCQVRVVRFYVSCCASSSPPPSPPPSPRRRTSTTTIHAQCSLPDLNHDQPRPVFDAQCSLPDLNHDHPRPVLAAGPQPRPSTPSVRCRTSTTTSHAQCSPSVRCRTSTPMPKAMPDRMSEAMPDRMPKAMPNRMPKAVPWQNDKMPDRMSEGMADRMWDNVR